MEYRMIGSSLSTFPLLFALASMILILGCAGTSPEYASEFSFEGNPDEAMAAGDYSRAIHLLTQEVNRSGGSGERFFKLGSAYYGMAELQASDPDLGGNPASAFGDAAQYFRKALKLNHPRARLMLAKAIYQNFRFEEAHTEVLAHLEINPKDGEAHAFAGQVLLALAQQEEDDTLLEEAMEHLQKALELDPQNDAAYLSLGDCFLQKREFPGAVEYYLRGVNHCPGSSLLHERLLYLADQGAGPEIKDILSFYEKHLDEQSATRTPEEEGLLWWFKGSWYDRKGNLHYSRGEYDLASKAYARYIECLERSGRICPAFQDDAELIAAAARLSRGWCLMELENFAGAEEAFFAALPYYPEDPNMILAIDNLGFRISEKEGYEAALGFFSRLTTLWGERHQWWNDYGFFSLETNMRSNAPAEKYEETLRIFQSALELKPGYPRYLNDSAMLIDYYLDPQGERKAEVEAMYEEAWKSGRQAFENPFSDEQEKQVMFGAFTDALVNLTRLFFKDGRIEEGRATLMELLEFSPDRREAMVLKGVLAIADEKGVTKPSPEDYLNALLELAREHFDAGRYRECLGVMQELFTVDPEHEEVLALTEKLNAAFREQAARGAENPDQEQ
ncbi:MAG: tetratricopeptide repeat protein [Planctomycetota bacterium]|jgi:tetratricopeptide (TPR) repeat protein